jgi:hypothetical protein
LRHECARSRTELLLWRVSASGRGEPNEIVTPSTKKATALLLLT